MTARGSRPRRCATVTRRCTGRRRRCGAGRLRRDGRGIGRGCWLGSGSRTGVEIGIEAAAKQFGTFGNDLGFDVGHGDVVRGAKFLETLEVLDGAAVEALGLDLVTHEENERVGLAAHYFAVALRKPVGTILSGNDLEAIGDFGVAQDVGGAGRLHGSFERAGEIAGLHVRDAVEGQLTEGNTLDGPHLLGVNRLIESHGVGAQGGNRFGVFDADYGVTAGVELKAACSGHFDHRSNIRSSREGRRFLGSD